jgi:hypothetical protein
MSDIETQTPFLFLNWLEETAGKSYIDALLNVTGEKNNNYIKATESDDKSKLTIIYHGSKAFFHEINGAIEKYKQSTPTGSYAQDIEICSSENTPNCSL